MIRAVTGPPHKQNKTKQIWPQASNRTCVLDITEAEAMKNKPASGDKDIFQRAMWLG